MYLVSSPSSPWCNFCRILKSNFANFKSKSLHNSIFSYIPMYFLANNLGRFVWMGWLKASLTWALSELLNFGTMDSRWVMVKVRASSRISSSCTRRCVASYKLNNPRTSLVRFFLNFPSWSVNFLNTSDLIQHHKRIN